MNRYYAYFLLNRENFIAYGSIFLFMIAVLVIPIGLIAALMQPIAWWVALVTLLPWIYFIDQMVRQATNSPRHKFWDGCNSSLGETTIGGAVFGALLFMILQGLRSL